ncbi:hypothetical protein B0T24DRAFT_681250 [Lasiosphaeria ovina]|uniref:Heterokaryon incompatibility domain-containing protein n=1 Tax=Lasiosphaeria ovina TaxID=92902 RepID=A0AAE0K417_9PEZI|nr:hypothetical protein B0T24DRAFT_681250 [Lasiosphaeria ovina]
MVNQARALTPDIITSIPYTPDGEPCRISHITLVSLARALSNTASASIGPTTSGPQTWDLIYKWISDCSANHPECHRSRIDDYIPSRILELNPSDKPYRLGLATEPCWGTLAGRTDVLMLTRSTLAQLRAPRPVASLPPTFRDAFEIVSRLGLRHLWIDRLCIVQDSPADWAAEAALMHDIYKHTYLNVSALGASSDQGGCLLSGGEHVVVYSDCKLTMPGHKLVAISGLAKDMQQRLAEIGASSTTYLAGLWECGLPNSLLWHRREGHLHPAPSAVYRAPSWSWAAVDGGVSAISAVPGWGGDSAAILPMFYTPGPRRVVSTSWAPSVAVW